MCIEEGAIGFIGGSGIYEIDGLEKSQWVKVDTPWGSPSDEVLTGKLNGINLVFLPRHGRGHAHPPSTIPFKANIAALKTLGVTDLISLSACGSLQENLHPGDFVIVDQFIDLTFAREKSFFESGCVGHVSVAHPTCRRLNKLCVQAARNLGITTHDGGTYLAMEGPQFSTLAESKMYREHWGCDVIGMTNMPEAKLAREAEICYATVAMVTDFDSWHPDHGEIDISSVIETLFQNADSAKNLVKALAVQDIRRKKNCFYGCDIALDNAIITAPEKRDSKLVKKLNFIAGRLLKL